MHSTVRPHAHSFTFQCPSLLPARRWQNISCSRTHRPCQPLQAHRVEIEHASGVTTLEVDEGQTILETALDAGLELSHDCKMGVCMTCPAKLVSGEVDQSAGMLDETAKEKGYTLLCVSEPRTDCRIKVIDEDEILEEVLCSSANIG